MPTFKSVSALVFCLMASLPSYALTPVSACGTYSVNDKYVVQADISSSSTTVACLHFTGIASAANGIDIDLNGHNVVSTAYHALDIDTSVGSVYLHDSVGTGSYKGKVGYNGTGPFVMPAVYILNSATDPTARILIAGIRAYGEVRIESTDKAAFPMKAFHSEYNHIYNGGLTLLRIDNAYSTGEQIDNRYDSTILVQGGFAVYDSDSPRVEYSTVIGGTGSNPASSTQNTDDGVIFSCSTSACTGAVADHVTAFDVFDLGWEGSGHWTNIHITNNSFYRPQIGGLGGFGVYHFAASNSEWTNNQVKASPRLFSIYAGTEGSTYFNDNTINGNKSDSSTVSQIGGDGNPYATYSNNTISNNDFGSGAAVILQTPGTIDGGNNRCGSTIPTGGFFTCH